MEILRKDVEKLVHSAEKLKTAHDAKKLQLFEIAEDGNRQLSDLEDLLDINELQDPNKSYDLYYNGIQSLLCYILPKDSTISKPIRELICILLTGKEKENLKYGKRGADSRMSTNSKMKDVIDVLSEWSESPYDYYKFAVILLRKNKELKYIPMNREISDY